jgi:thiol-disulfide isomerase/thioredoxin
MIKKFTYMQTMFLTATTILLFATIFGAIETGQRRIKNKPGPSLNGATSWVNTRPLTLTDLRGKVVLVDFWTYTCINWRRTLPYVREWAKRYKDEGLIVIGVHTPEFSFERKLENVGNSIKEMNIEYRVAVDNDYAIWDSFQNQFWPALYLIDASGQIRYQKFGEGDYTESELQIQKLLKEISAKNVSTELVTVHPKGFEAAADWEHLRSSENYLGYNRAEGFTSPEGLIADKHVVYSVPNGLALNHWALAGGWITGKESITNTEPGKIIYRFHARDIHLIMGPAKPGTSVRFRVLINGKAPGRSHGLDVDSNGYGIVKEQRMYQLIRQEGPVTDTEFQIDFLDSDIEVYDFTFG